MDNWKRGMDGQTVAQSLVSSRPQSAVWSCYVWPAFLPWLFLPSVTIGAGPMDQAIALLDEVIGFAKENAESARTVDDQQTWRAHERNCRRVRSYLTNRPETV